MFKEIGQNKFEVKDFLTARDSRAIQAALLEGMEFDSAGKPLGGINGNVVAAQEDALIKACVVSVNDVKEPEQVLNTCLDLKKSEYDELLELIRPLMGLPDQNGQN